jgi:transposase
MPIIYVGADISKSKIDFYYDFGKKSYHQVIDNEESALEIYLSGLVRELAEHEVQVIMEATGTYGERLMHSLHRQGIAFSVISPSQSSAFMRSENLTTINDKQAAKALSLFGQQKKPAPYRMPDALEIQLKQMVSALNRLKEDLQRINNQIHADSFRVENPSVLTQIWLQRKAETETHIKTLEDNINALTQENFQSMIENLCSIKGVGKTIATTFVVLTQGFAAFQSAKQLAKFVGLCPTQNDSGSSVRKPKHIPKQGVGILKSLLFNAARSVLRSDNVFKRFFLRLKANGKNGKVALTAVMRKILTHIFAIAKSGQIFQPNFYFL